MNGKDFYIRSSSAEFLIIAKEKALTEFEKYRVV